MDDYAFCLIPNFILIFEVVLLVSNELSKMICQSVAWQAECLLVCLLSPWLGIASEIA